MKILGITLGVLMLFWGGAEKDITNLKSYPFPMKEELDTMARLDYVYRVFEKDEKVKYEKQLNKYQSYGRTNRWENSPLPFELHRDSFDYHDGYGGRLVTFKVDDGWLIALNEGEFGGSCWWYSEDGSRRQVLIYHLNVVRFHKIGDRFFAMEGIAHGWPTRGQILEICRVDGEWEASPFVEIPYFAKSSERHEDWRAIPHSSLITNDNDFLIITDRNLMKISLDKSIEFLVEDGLWSSGSNDRARVNSFLLNNNDIYIGMNGGIFKTNIKKPSKQEWLKE